jgi:hypothetical protein
VATGCVRHLTSRIRKLATRATVFVRVGTLDRWARTVFLQPAGQPAPATAMAACRGWSLQEPPSHQRRAARLRSSWHGLRGCCWPRCGRCGHRAGPRLVALWAHSVSVQRAALWPRQSSASWFVDEYGSRALDNIDSVLGPTCGATGTRPLYASESRRGRVCELWAHYGPHPVVHGMYMYMLTCTCTCHMYM